MHRYVAEIPLMIGMMTGAIVGGKSVEQAARLQSKSTPSSALIQDEAHVSDHHVQ
jgi:hypothetical protein